MISRYFHTVRHLKFKQIYWRIWYNFSRPCIFKSPLSDLRSKKNKFCPPIKKKKSLLDKETFSFLNKSFSLSEIGWNGHSNIISQLWRYNQHYFDDLNSIRSFQRKEWHDQILKNWVNDNKFGKGVGWHSYPTSLRIVNWIKWHLLGNNLSDTCIQSLGLQAKWLNKRIEWHILGNHLFSNAKALVFAGIFFSNKESDTWLKKGLKIINDELNEQILSDGSNFERSPMYHAIFLEDVLDLINISKSYPNIIQIETVNKWIQTVKSMFFWLDSTTHPDGDISFFNDAACGIAPKLDELKKYAQELEVNYMSKKFNKVTHLADSGYVRISLNNMVGLLDVATIGPEYLPSHAHADTLSFEISLFGQRLLVNSGVSEYGFSLVRQYERSTKAHNTVVVNDENSSEVWKGFRVARRAYPFGLKIEEKKNFISITCAHDGYKRLKGKPIHKRNWQFFESSLIITDHIQGFFKKAHAYFHFHNSIVVKKSKKKTWNLKMSNSEEIIFEVKSGEPIIETSYYSAEFGKRLKTQCIKVSLDKEDGSCVKISW